MEKIEQILNKFSDRELAYFVKYKMKTYVHSTQKDITKYIDRERELTSNQLELFIEKGEKPFVSDSYLVCKRCGSVKMFIYDTEFFPQEFKTLSHYEMLDLSQDIIKKRTIECFVCGNIIIDPNNEDTSFWAKIKNFLNLV